MKKTKGSYTNRKLKFSDRLKSTGESDGGEGVGAADKKGLALRGLVSTSSISSS